MTQQEDKPTPMKFVRMKEACRRAGLCEGTMRNGIRAGIIPKPRKIGVRAIGFLESEFAAWLDARPPVIWVKPKTKRD